MVQGGQVHDRRATFDWQQLASSDRNFNGPGSGVWGGPVVTYQPSSRYVRKNVFQDVAVVDLNGDGRMDLLKSLQNGTWQACLSTGTSFACQSWAGPATKVTDAVFGDFNADGRSDFAYAGATGTPVQVCLSTGSGFSCSGWSGVSSPAAPLPTMEYLVGDFNGDGRDDLVGSSFCYSTGSNFTCNAFTIYNWGGLITEIDPFCPEEQVRQRNIAGDYNGDGRLDYLAIRQWSAVCPPDGVAHNYSWQLYTTVDDGTTRGFVPGTASGLPSVGIDSGRTSGHSSTNLGLFNTDAYGDIVLGGLAGGVIKVCRGTGQGFACTTPTTNATYNDSALGTVADFDGDGRPDAYHSVDAQTARVCQLGLESALSCQTWAPPPLVNAGVLGTFGSYGDFNGDGKTDMAIYDDANQRWVVQLAGGTRPDLLSQVTNGLGHATQFSHLPSSNSSVYTRDSNAVYPQRDVQDATPVVSQVRTGNGIGGWLITDYRYGGLKMDLAGRGSLGMRWMEATDQVSGVLTRTEFAQSWPYTGMLQRQIATHVSSGVELARVENTLALKTGCTNSGQLPYVSSSVTTGKDLNGASLPQTTVTAQTDCYGNQTNVTSTTIGGGETYSSTTVNTFANTLASWRIGDTVQQDSYQYDALGNVDSRTFRNAAGGLVTETFAYDSLNRLTGSTIGSTTKTYGYDELGNLTSKTGVGSYTYPASGGTSVRPHAVSGVTGTLNGVTNPSFSYDAAGNLLSGAGRTWTWTAANRPKDITQGTLQLAFLYGPERQRVRQTVSNGGTTLKTIHYAGAVEKEVSGSVTQTRTYLPRGAGVIIETTGGASPGTVVRYFHRDRLGSVNVITSESGAVLERLSYDPWGRRRNADGSDAPGNLSSAIDDTGYTGHEMLDDLALVNMNGRVYDPSLARVASADPTVPDPTDLQAFNRYSYVFNSPMVFNDPSGFAPSSKEPTVEDIGAIQKPQTLETVVVTGTRSPGQLLASRASAGGVLSMAAGGASLVAPANMEGGLRLIGSRVLGAIGSAGLVPAAAITVAASPIVGVVWIASNNPNNGSDQANADALNIAPGADSASGGAMPPDDDGPNSKYDRTTKERSVENRKTNVGRAEFEKNLRDGGWKESKSADGKVTIFEKDGARYVLRDNAKSTGGPTADFYNSGSSSVNLKIRLGGQ